MPISQFEIKVPAGALVRGETEGNEESKRIVIFVHGFGVKRDAHGLFTDISASLAKKNFLVRFDLSKELKPGLLEVPDYATQIAMLKTVLNRFYSCYPDKKIAIIAHSLGCVIAAGALAASPVKYEAVSNVILLAGPLESAYERMKKRFTSRPGVIWDEAGTTSIPRSDGSMTVIGPAFWDQAKTTEPIPLYQKLAALYKTSFLKAKNDEVITSGDYKTLKATPDLNFKEIDGNHGFTGAARADTIALVTTLL